MKSKDISVLLTLLKLIGFQIPIQLDKSQESQFSGLIWISELRNGLSLYTSTYSSDSTGADFTINSDEFYFEDLFCSNCGNENQK